MSARPERTKGKSVSAFYAGVDAAIQSLGEENVSGESYRPLLRSLIVRELGRIKNGN